MQTTQHAAVRAQQRGVPDLVIDLLVRFGAATEQAGAELRYFDRRAWKRAVTYTGGLLRNTHWSDAYLVVGRDARIITVGYRLKRVRHK